MFFTYIVRSVLIIIAINRHLLIFLLFIISANYSFAQNRAIDSLEQVMAEEKNDSLKASATIALINELMRTDLSSAKVESHKLLEWTGQLPEQKWISSGYVFLITIYQKTGEPDSAEYFLNLLKQHAENNPSNTRITINYNQSASLFYKNQGEFKKALTLMMNNIPLMKEKNESQAGLHLNIGNTYMRLADYKSAVSHHLHALELFEELGNKRGVSFCFQSLGSDFYNLGEYQQAYQYYQKSIAIKEDLNDKRGIIIAQIGLGDALLAMEKYKGAQENYLKALKSAREMKLVSEEIKINYNLGLLFRDWQNIDKARSFFMESLNKATEIEDSLYIRNSKTELVRLDENLRNNKQAEEMLQTHLVSSKNNGDRKTELTYYKKLSDYYLETGDFEKAFNYLKQYEQVKDSLEGGDILLQITMLKEQFENEKKEKEIALLKKDQQLQALAFSRERSNFILVTVILGASLIIGILFINRYRVVNRSKRLLEIERMRNNIARDLHDDIGSTLSSINILSQLALKENNAAQSYFQRINAQSSRIMESMSDIVWSINPINDSFEQVLSKMKEFAGEILEPKNISYSFKVDEEVRNLQFQVETRKNIFLIFKEALNNAAKYSEANIIIVEIYLRHNLFSLSITDNGKGYDPLPQSNGNGRRNMNDRAASISGRLTQDSAPRKGTKILLEVPVT